MSYYKNKYGYKEVNFPNAVYYGDKSISLPVHSKLAADDIEYICNNLITIMEN